MKSLLHSAKFLAMDMASTLFFLGLYMATRSIPVSVAAGVALGFAQIGWERWKRRPIETMQWMSLFLVVASGIASLVTNDPRFIMYKASAIYVIVGIVMLKPGWMNRYLPQVAIELVPDLAFGFGFVWAALMFVTAIVNIVAARTLGFLAWGAFMSSFALGAKLGLFGVQYATMRLVARRRWTAARAKEAPAAVGAVSLPAS